VHGACGANAARTALRASRARIQRVSAAGIRLAIGRWPSPVPLRRLRRTEPAALVALMDDGG